MRVVFIIYWSIENFAAVYIHIDLMQIERYQTIKLPVVWLIEKGKKKEQTSVRPSITVP